MRFLVLATASLLALLGCHGKTDPPSDAPSGVQAIPGDGLVVVQWDALPDLTYWIFFALGDSVSVTDSSGAIAIRRAVSPRPVTGLVNGNQYAFVVNATDADSAAGPNSQIVTAKPRLAGDTGTWSSGTPIGTPPRNLRSMAFNGSRFVAVGDVDTVSATPTVFWGDYDYPSIDPPGVTAWTAPTSLPPNFAEDLTAVTFSAQFVALGVNGSVISSVDGLTWVAAKQIPATGMRGIASSFLSSTTIATIAVGDGGAIFRATDLQLGWNPVPSGTTSDLTGVTVLNGKFVVTGANGTLLSSDDGGATFGPPLVTNTTATLRGAAFKVVPADVQYVAVGDGGTILTSKDAIAWAPATNPSPANLTSIIVGGASFSRFLAVGQGGAVVYSDDGVKWVPASAGSNNLTNVQVAIGLYLAVGDAGTNTASK